MLPLANKSAKNAMDAAWVEFLKRQPDTKDWIPWLATQTMILLGYAPDLTELLENIRSSSDMVPPLVIHHLCYLLDSEVSPYRKKRGRQAKTYTLADFCAMLFAVVEIRQTQLELRGTVRCD